ncbi:hypothetical protein L3X38_003023 [Prunus dulcis]|uniref:Uncharacterized protein n=1 Tax=Prunus dulcis TaxID=3755 RepID=A0AAD4X041_PRUDU|nr:hypothetical protein L3X38_003023 [Prunus dulcis]
MSSPRSRAHSSSASIPPDYITGAGLMPHAIEKYPGARALNWFGPIPAEVAELLKKDAEAPLCFENTSALASYSWVKQEFEPVFFPSSEVRNSQSRWADWIDRLLPRYGGHWRTSGGFMIAILLSKQSINRDENLLAAALCFWNSASIHLIFRVGPYGAHSAGYGSDLWV